MRHSTVLALGAFAILLVGMCGVAVCPPGVVLIDSVSGAPEPLLANTTYCVSESITLGSNSKLPSMLILQDRTVLVGAFRHVQIVGSSGAEAVVSIRGRDTSVRDLTVVSAAGVGYGIRVEDEADFALIQAVTVDDVGGAFVYSHMWVKGFYALVRECRVRTSGSTPVGILVDGGDRSAVRGNRLTVLPGASMAFRAIQVTAGSGHEVSDNVIVNDVGAAGMGEENAPQISVSSPYAQIEGNTITFSTPVGLGAVGIRLDGRLGQVLNNTIENPAGFGTNGSLNGIWIGTGAANASVLGNWVTGAGYLLAEASHHRGNAVFVEARGVHVRDNPMLTTSVARSDPSSAGIEVDNAAGVSIAPSAVQTAVVGNSEIRAATSGIVVGASSAIVQYNTVAFAATGEDAGRVVPQDAGPQTYFVPACGIAVYAADAVIERNVIASVAQSGGSAHFNVWGGHGIGLLGSLPEMLQPAYTGSSGYRVIGNEISGVSHHGISVESALAEESGVVANNTISGSARHGISVDTDADGLRLMANTVIGCGHAGIIVKGGAQNTVISHNELRDNGVRGSSSDPSVAEALVVAGQANGTQVINNTISSNAPLSENRGIRISDSLDVVVDRNWISNPAQGTLAHGIVIGGGTRNGLFTCNTVKGMLSCGMHVLGNAHATIEGNMLTDNTIGMLYEHGSISIDVLGCNVISGGAVGVQIEASAHMGLSEFTGNAITSPVRIRNRGIAPIKAQGNWWGHASGPPAGTIFGRVDHSSPLEADPCAPPVPPSG